MAYILIPLPCRSFSTEQYFDSHGFFITIILGFPVMFNMTLLIVRDGDIYIYIYNPYTCMRYNVRIIYIYIYIYIYSLLVPDIIVPLVYDLTCCHQTRTITQQGEKGRHRRETSGGFLHPCRRFFTTRP